MASTKDRNEALIDRAQFGLSPQREEPLRRVLKAISDLATLYDDELAVATWEQLAVYTRLRPRTVHKAIVTLNCRFNLVERIHPASLAGAAEYQRYKSRPKSKGNGFKVIWGRLRSADGAIIESQPRHVRPAPYQSPTSAEKLRGTSGLWRPSLRPAVLGMVDEAFIPADKRRRESMRQILRFLIVEADPEGFVVASYREFGTACRLSSPTVKALLRSLDREHGLVEILHSHQLPTTESLVLWMKSHAWHRCSANAFRVDLRALRSLCLAEKMQRT